MDGQGQRRASGELPGATSSTAPWDADSGFAVQLAVDDGVNGGYMSPDNPQARLSIPRRIDPVTLTARLCDAGDRTGLVLVLTRGDKRVTGPVRQWPVVAQSSYNEGSAVSLTVRSLPAGDYVVVCCDASPPDEPPRMIELHTTAGYLTPLPPQQLPGAKLQLTVRAPAFNLLGPLDFSDPRNVQATLVVKKETSVRLGVRAAPLDSGVPMAVGLIIVRRSNSAVLPMDSFERLDAWGVPTDPLQRVATVPFTRPGEPLSALVPVLSRGTYGVLACRTSTGAARINMTIELPGDPFAQLSVIPSSVLVVTEESHLATSSSDNPAADARDHDGDAGGERRDCSDDASVGSDSGALHDELHRPSSSNRDADEVVARHSELVTVARGRPQVPMLRNETDCATVLEGVSKALTAASPVGGGGVLHRFGDSSFDPSVWQLPCPCRVVRPDGVCARPRVFVEADGHRPDDFAQKGLASVTWVAALLHAFRVACPRLARRVVYPAMHNADGVYTVRLTLRDGRPRAVVVDDRLPVNAAGRLAFAPPRQTSDIWLAIVLKAVAKLAGGYEALLGAAKHDSSGSDRGVFSPAQVLGLVSGNESQMAQVPTSMSVTSWADVVSWRAAGDLVMTAGALSVRRGPTSSARYHSGGQQPVGTVVRSTSVSSAWCGTALSILRCVEVDGYRLVQVASPRGACDWSGEWAPDSPMWRQRPSVAATCGVDADDAEASIIHHGDGLSRWIPWEDFAGDLGSLVRVRFVSAAEQLPFAADIESMFDSSSGGDEGRTRVECELDAHGAKLHIEMASGSSATAKDGNLFSWFPAEIDGGVGRHLWSDDARADDAHVSPLVRRAATITLPRDCRRVVLLPRRPLDTNWFRLSVRSTAVVRLSKIQPKSSVIETSVAWPSGGCRYKAAESPSVTVRHVGNDGSPASLAVEFALDASCETEAIQVAVAEGRRGTEYPSVLVAESTFDHARRVSAEAAPLAPGIYTVYVTKRRRSDGGGTVTLRSDAPVELDVADEKAEEGWWL